jgi:HEXXH motif-containing protein
MAGTRYHTLSREQFRSLARGEGDAESIRLLLSGERSRRLLMLWQLRFELRKQPMAMRPMPPIDTALSTLGTIEAKDPDAVDAVLMSPQFGIWLARALRLLRGGATSPAPLWAELGHLHAAVYAVAIRAGVELKTRVPVLRGYAMIPTLGMARLPGPLIWDIAVASTAPESGATLRLGDETVRVPAQPEVTAPRWWGQRRVKVTADDTTLSIALDDIDPYRDLADPVPPARLDERAMAEWIDRITDAWRIINRIWPESAPALATGMSAIAPLPEDERKENRSASTGDGFGAALISPPPDPATLAVNLVHEFQHIKLGGLLHLVPILDHEANSVLTYAPWRDDPRPLPGLLQGVFAFFGIAGFWQRYRACTEGAERVVADFEFAYSRRQTRLGMRTLARSRFLTPLGRTFVDELARHVYALQADRVPIKAARDAWAIATDHQSTWRIRHLHPDGDAVGRLADAFIARAAPRTVRSVSYTVAADGGHHWYHGRLALHRIGQASPERLRSIATGVSAVPASWGVTRADVAFAVGDSIRAEAAFRAMITSDPANIHAWSGLVMATAANRSTPAWRTLVRRPELVRAIYLHARQHNRSVASPVEVAEWLRHAGGMTTEPATF